MNRPTKLLFVALGVTASIGLWSQLSTKPLTVSRPVPTQDPFICVCPPVITITATPTPVPKKPLPSGFRRVVCKKCGEEYDLPNYCNMGGIVKEEIQHQHLSADEKANAIKAAKEEAAEEMTYISQQNSLPSADKQRQIKHLQQHLKLEIEAYQ